MGWAWLNEFTGLGIAVVWFVTSLAVIGWMERRDVKRGRIRK